MLSLSEKNETIFNNKDIIVASIKLYLDKLYELTENSFDENGNLNPGLTPDEGFENFVKSLKDDQAKYEEVLKRVKADESLSTSEADLVGLALFYTSARAKQNIQALEQTRSTVQNLYNKLLF